jgi:hypothetical protein
VQVSKQWAECEKDCFNSTPTSHLSGGTWETHKNVTKKKYMANGCVNINHFQNEFNIDFFCLFAYMLTLFPVM